MRQSIPRTQLHREKDKWLATFRINWSKQMAYKLNFLLLVLGPILVFFFIRYNLWSSIYQLQGVTEIQGYNRGQMLSYQAWVMIVALLAMGYSGMNLAEEIRLGRISAYLLYPFGFWPFHTASFLAFQWLQFFISFLTLSALLLRGWVLWPTPQGLFHGLLFSLCVSFFWYQANFLIGILAFWLEETWILRVMLITVAQFFSGSLIPLELFPSWLVDILQYLPFPYLTYVPVKIFMGTYTGSMPLAYSAILIWSLILSAVVYGVWRRGLRNYTAAGM